MSPVVLLFLVIATAAFNPGCQTPTYCREKCGIDFTMSQSGIEAGGCCVDCSVARGFSVVDGLCNNLCNGEWSSNKRSPTPSPTTMSPTPFPTPEPMDVCGSCTSCDCVRECCVKRCGSSEDVLSVSCSNDDGLVIDDCNCVE